MKTPPVVPVCQIVGTGSIAGGAFLLALSTGASTIVLAIALAVLVSSVFWFAIARAIVLLAQIEFNTRKE
jgi:hypothetical protein